MKTVRDPVVFAILFFVAVAPVGAQGAEESSQGTSGVSQGSPGAPPIDAQTLEAAQKLLGLPPGQNSTNAIEALQRAAGALGGAPQGTTPGTTPQTATPQGLTPDAANAMPSGSDPGVNTTGALGPSPSLPELPPGSNPSTDAPVDERAAQTTPGQSALDWALGSTGSGAANQPQEAPTARVRATATTPASGVLKGLGASTSKSSGVLKGLGGAIPASGATGIMKGLGGGIGTNPPAVQAPKGKMPASTCNSSAARPASNADSTALPPPTNAPTSDAGDMIWDGGKRLK